ncbi:MAG: GC-type dockerin domain-anchored protein [Phycisphaerales bacterium]|nr:GC-type dockerin domain-anchored protein [Phycisphaerales bacterium]
MILRWPILVITSIAVTMTFGSDESSGVWTDPLGDATIRRTDDGNNAKLPVGFKAIDLKAVNIQGWKTSTPKSDPYKGEVVNYEADLVRIQVIVDGLVSPPGPLALSGSDYNPTQFGDRPLYGFFEIDIDHQKNSGGEFMPIARNRYLANVGRFGLSPKGSISDRIARRGNDIDSNFYTEPQFERSGGEFALQLCGCFEPKVEYQNGNHDSIFDIGETWIVSGRFFQRMESFADESGFYGGSDFGIFDPEVNLLFEHNEAFDKTTVTLVFPITNAGSAAMRGDEEVEDLDLNISNQTSIEEVLDDLIFGAKFATGPLRILVEEWESSEVEKYRKPSDWNVRAILGTAPIEPDSSALLIWTDTGFDEVFGDLDNDDLQTDYDAKIVEEFIEDTDGSKNDADGIVNGQVEISNYGFNFLMNDLSGDGFVSNADIFTSFCSADINNDGTLNFFDVSGFLSAFGFQDPIADFNNDGTFNFFDVSAFLSVFAAGCP